MESAKAIRHFLHLKPWPDVKLHIVHFKESGDTEPFLVKDAADFCQAHGFEVQTDTLDGQARKDLMPFAQDRTTPVDKATGLVNSNILAGQTDDLYLATRWTL